MKGLSQEEAKRRLERDGANELSNKKRRTWLNVLLEVVREPMFFLLLASAGIYFALGDKQEALMLIGMIVLVVVITVYQQNKTEHTIEALRDLSSPRALVIRNGERQRISGREVVIGDLVVLFEGDRVPADGILVSGPGISVDESLVTGESVAVWRYPGASIESSVYSGTLVIQGQGIMEVTATGMHTKLGEIGHSLETIQEENTLLQKEVDRLVRLFASWGILFCLLVLLTYGLLRGHWMNGFLAGIALAMSVLPEEFPMVLTVFFALGAWRIAKSQVLTRKTHAIEALGAVTVLCTDKTGTLTLNTMSLVTVVNAQNEQEVLTTENTLKPEFIKILAFGALASQPEGIDPMDKSIWEVFKKLPNINLQNFKSPEHIYPFSQTFPAMTIIWADKDHHNFIIAAKGAPETILKLCKLEADQSVSIIEQVHKMAEEGLRILAVATSKWFNKPFPNSPEAFTFEYVGLLGYRDPIRSNVPEAIQTCHRAGIRIIMLTGDYPETARSIAREVGLKNVEHVITGSMLTEMQDYHLMDVVKTTNIFARMVPSQKLRLVNALKANGEIVAMTGDGVNDAPALKAAHIGIAMGQRGTDVAREAAHLVLLDDEFSSIVKTIQLGRRIFVNLRKAMLYIFSIHIPIAGMAVLPLVFSWPLVLFPAQIGFIEMIIDPACSLAFEAEPSETNIMNCPPRPINEPLFSKKVFLRSIFAGITALLAILSVYGFALKQHYGEADARTMAFVTLLIVNLMLITSNLTGNEHLWKLPFFKNKAYWLVTGGAITSLSLIMYFPFLRNLFHFNELHPNDYIICLIVCGICLLVLEGLKAIRFKPSQGNTL